MRSAVVQMPGTCGELVQGTLDGIPFHVSCPVDVYSTVTVNLDNKNPELSCQAGCEKAASALRILLDRHGCENVGGVLRIESDLPRAKGMASSTADVAGAIVAGAMALNLNLSSNRIAEIALAVEPTDGSLFPGIVLFDHRKGKLLRRLGPAPAIDVLVIDTGGEVDTLAFNAVDRQRRLQASEPQVRKALALVEAGIETGELGLLGEGATLSAILNQEILYKPFLEQVLELTLELGGLGVCVGHSGTVIGAMWQRGRRESRNLKAVFQSRVPGIEVLTHCQLVDGGAKVFAGEPH